MKKALRNLDMTYCSYNKCKKKDKCKRYINNYSDDKFREYAYRISMLDGSICANNNYDVFLPFNN